MKKIMALVAFSVVVSSTYADERLYAGLGYTSGSYKDTSTTGLGSFPIKAVSGNIGYVVYENLAVEGYWMNGLSSSTNPWATGGNAYNIEVKLKDGYGVSLKPFVKLGPSAELFFHVGTSHSNGEIKVTRASTGASATTSIDGGRTFYGTGLAFKVSDQWSVVLDYKDFGDKGGSKYTAMTLGARYNFK